MLSITEHSALLQTVPPPPPCHAAHVKQSGTPFAGFSGEWGATGISDALYTISNDMQRIQSLLPELSPQDRCYASLRHTSLCLFLLCMHVVSPIKGCQGAYLAPSLSRHDFTMQLSRTPALRLMLDDCFMLHFSVGCCKDIGLVGLVNGKPDGCVDSSLTDRATTPDGAYGSSLRPCLARLYACDVSLHSLSLDFKADAILTFRGTEVLESTVRQHIGACFSALEQRVLATLSEASRQLATGTHNPTDKLISQVWHLCCPVCCLVTHLVLQSKQASGTTFQLSCQLKGSPDTKGSTNSCRTDDYLEAD